MFCTAIGSGCESGFLFFFNGSEKSTDVLGTNVEEQADQQQGAGGLHIFQNARLDRSTSDHFHHRQHCVAAIEHGEWQHVKDAEIDIDDN